MIHMIDITKIAIPPDCLLKTYDDIPHAYADAYQTQIQGKIKLSDFIIAFFDSPIFKAERVLITLTTISPTFKKDVLDLAEGNTNKFAMWELEQRGENELLLKVRQGRIRTWLAVIPQAHSTKLLFGSAVLPKSENGDIGWIFRKLTVFHEIYSKILLKSAAKRVLK